MRLLFCLIVVCTVQERPGCSVVVLCSSVRLVSVCSLLLCVVYYPKQQSQFSSLSTLIIQ